MNDLIIIKDGQAVTTTLMIAEGTENSHEGVIKLVRRYVSDLEEFGLVRFEIQPRLEGQHGGGDTEFALLNEHQATLLMTYMKNTEIVRGFKKRLVKAFFEMAGRLSNQEIDPQNLSRMQILQLALEAEQENEQLKIENAELKPKADFHDKVIVAPDAISVAKAAKILGTGRTRLFSHLRQIKWVTRRNEPYQDKIELGYMDVKLGSWEHPEHGLQQSVTALITGKGLAKLQKSYTTENAIT